MVKDKFLPKGKLCECNDLSDQHRIEYTKEKPDYVNCICCPCTKFREYKGTFSIRGIRAFLRHIKWEEENLVEKLTTTDFTEGGEITRIFYLHQGYARILRDWKLYVEGD